MASVKQTLEKFVCLMCRACFSFSDTIPVLGQHWPLAQVQDQLFLVPYNQPKSFLFIVINHYLTRKHKITALQIRESASKTFIDDLKTPVWTKSFSVFHVQPACSWVHHLLSLDCSSWWVWLCTTALPWTSIFHPTASRSSSLHPSCPVTRTPPLAWHPLPWRTCNRSCRYLDPDCIRAPGDTFTVLKVTPF